MSVKKKALGRGLDALIGGYDEPAVQAPAAPPQGKRVLQIPINAIVPNPFQPRKHFAEESIEELAASIEEHGVLQPLVLRQRGAVYEIVAGERRWRASRRLNRESVPALIETFDDQQMLELALIENIQREELNAIEEGRAYRQLIDEFNLTQEQVAEHIGKSRVAVTNTLRLLRLPEEIQTWVEEDKISAGHARTLLSLESSASQMAMAREIMNAGLSVREAERRVRQLLKKPRPALHADKPKLDINVQDLEEKLSLHLGLQVRIQPSSNSAGKIEVLYQTLDDFQRVFDHLGIELDDSK